MIGRALSIQNIQQKRYDTVPFTGEWQDAFGNSEKTGIWVVYGATGNGKSAFCLHLVRELAKLDSTVAVHAEQCALLKICVEGLKALCKYLCYPEESL